MQMAAMPARLKSAAVILGLWTLYALTETTHSYFEYEMWKKPQPLWRIAYGEFSFAYLWALATPGVLWVGRRFRLARPHVVRNLGIQILSAMVFMISVRLAWDLARGPLKVIFEGETSFRQAVLAISSTYEYTLLAYLMILVAGYARDYQRRYRDEFLRAARLRTEMVQAQLQSVKMQLQPHFLFNTLHTIAALVQESPPAAEKTISRLSDLLRLTLEAGKMTEIPLEDELHFAELYLEIERTRYEERLATRFDVEDVTRNALVPSFILQPLVENAIRHGIAVSAAPGHVIICAEKRGETLLLQVRNTGPGLARNTYREGVGLGATRSRLMFLYGERHAFELRNLTSGEVQASITLPFATDKNRRGENGADTDADRRRREVGARATAPALDA